MEAAHAEAIERAAADAAVDAGKLREEAAAARDAHAAAVADLEDKIRMLIQALNDTDNERRRLATGLSKPARDAPASETAPPQEAVVSPALALDISRVDSIVDRLGSAASSPKSVRFAADGNDTPLSRPPKSDFGRARANSNDESFPIFVQTPEMVGSADDTKDESTSTLPIPDAAKRAKNSDTPPPPLLGSPRVKRGAATAPAAETADAAAPSRAAAMAGALQKAAAAGEAAAREAALEGQLRDAQGEAARLEEQLRDAERNATRLEEQLRNDAAGRNAAEGDAARVAALEDQLRDAERNAAHLEKQLRDAANRNAAESDAEHMAMEGQLRDAQSEAARLAEQLRDAERNAARLADQLRDAQSALRAAEEKLAAAPSFASGASSAPGAVAAQDLEAARDAALQDQQALQRAVDGLEGRVAQLGEDNEELRRVLARYPADPETVEKDRADLKAVNAELLSMLEDTAEKVLAGGGMPGMPPSYGGGGRQRSSPHASVASTAAVAEGRPGRAYSREVYADTAAGAARRGLLVKYYERLCAHRRLQAARGGDHRHWLTVLWQTKAAAAEGTAAQHAADLLRRYYAVWARWLKGARQGARHREAARALLCSTDAGLRRWRFLMWQAWVSARREARYYWNHQDALRMACRYLLEHNKHRFARRYFMAWLRWLLARRPAAAAGALSAGGQGHGVAGSGADPPGRDGDGYDDGDARPPRPGRYEDAGDDHQADEGRPGDRYGDAVGAHSEAGRPDRPKRAGGAASSFGDVRKTPYGVARHGANVLLRQTQRGLLGRHFRMWKDFATAKREDGFYYRLKAIRNGVGYCLLRHNSLRFLARYYRALRDYARRRALPLAPAEGRPRPPAGADAGKHGKAARLGGRVDVHEGDAAAAADHRVGWLAAQRRQDLLRRYYRRWLGLVDAMKGHFLGLTKAAFLHRCTLRALRWRYFVKLMAWAVHGHRRHSKMLRAARGVGIFFGGAPSAAVLGDHYPANATPHSAAREAARAAQPRRRSWNNHTHAF
eukprot:TRINITY_DN2388_c0_g1_i1.p1 TRINITY_DN2388_c0_g1~~TRINITY_DN2388_c0_g1_i1.p1  ORF type:complete len:1072 (+),score=392.40 TRINITY_DN2388_c0_g1_i1:174-3218(+)